MANSPAGSSRSNRRGCMGGFAHFFDFHQSLHAKKLLTAADKKHNTNYALGLQPSSGHNLQLKLRSCTNVGKNQFAKEAIAVSKWPRQVAVKDMLAGESRKGDNSYCTKQTKKNFVEAKNAGAPPMSLVARLMGLDAVAAAENNSKPLMQHAQQRESDREQRPPPAGDAYDRLIARNCRSERFRDHLCTTTLTSSSPSSQCSIDHSHLIFSGKDPYPPWPPSRSANVNRSKDDLAALRTCHWHEYIASGVHVLPSSSSSLRSTYHNHSSCVYGQEEHQVRADDLCSHLAAVGQTLFANGSGKKSKEARQPRRHVWTQFEEEEGDLDLDLAQMCSTTSSSRRSGGLCCKSLRSSKMSIIGQQQRPPDLDDIHGVFAIGDKIIAMDQRRKLSSRSLSDYHDDKRSMSRSICMAASTAPLTTSRHERAPTLGMDGRDMFTDHFLASLPIQLLQNDDAVVDDAGRRTSSSSAVLPLRKTTLNNASNQNNNNNNTDSVNKKKTKKEKGRGRHGHLTAVAPASKHCKNQLDRFQGTREFVDAIAFLQANKEYFRKYLKDPNSVLAKHLKYWEDTRGAAQENMPQYYSNDRSWNCLGQDPPPAAANRSSRTRMSLREKATNVYYSSKDAVQVEDTCSQRNDAQINPPAGYERHCRDRFAGRTRIVVLSPAPFPSSSSSSSSSSASSSSSSSTSRSSSTAASEKPWNSKGFTHHPPEDGAGGNDDGKRKDVLRELRDMLHIEKQKNKFNSNRQSQHHMIDGHFSSFCDPKEIAKQIAKHARENATISMASAAAIAADAKFPAAAHRIQYSTMSSMNNRISSGGLQLQQKTTRCNDESIIGNPKQRCSFSSRQVNVEATEDIDWFAHYVNSINNRIVGDEDRSARRSIYDRSSAEQPAAAAAAANKKKAEGENDELFLQRWWMNDGDGMESSSNAIIRPQSAAIAGGMSSSEETSSNGDSAGGGQVVLQSAATDSSSPCQISFRDINCKGLPSQPSPVSVLDSPFAQSTMDFSITGQELEVLLLKSSESEDQEEESSFEFTAAAELEEEDEDRGVSAYDKKNSVAAAACLLHPSASEYSTTVNGLMSWNRRRRCEDSDPWIEGIDCPNGKEPFLLHVKDLLVASGLVLGRNAAISVDWLVSDQNLPLAIADSMSKAMQSKLCSENMAAAGTQEDRDLLTSRLLVDRINEALCEILAPYSRIPCGGGIECMSKHLTVPTGREVVASVWKGVWELFRSSSGGRAGGTWSLEKLVYDEVGRQREVEKMGMVTEKLVREMEEGIWSEMVEEVCVCVRAGQ